MMTRDSQPQQRCWKPVCGCDRDHWKRQPLDDILAFGQMVCLPTFLRSALPPFYHRDPQTGLWAIDEEMSLVMSPQVQS
jgi:hypothetical protein